MVSNIAVLKALFKHARALGRPGVLAAAIRRLEGFIEAASPASDFSALARGFKAEIDFVQSRRWEIASALAEAISQERLRPYSEHFMHRRRGAQREPQIKLHETPGESAPLAPRQMGIVEALRGGQGAEAIEVWPAPMVPEGVSRLDRNMAELDAFHPPAAKILEDWL